MKIYKYHQSVMLNESIQALNIDPDGTYIDATFGWGGHAQKILEKLNSGGRLIALDQDISAINDAKKNFEDSRLELIHSAFSNLKTLLDERNLCGKINGILMDLGVSSPQLDNPERGFSFNKNAALDMRMNQTTGISALQWLACADEAEIANVIYKFGEEKKSRSIARAIKKYQKTQTIKTTLQLANIISKVVKSKNKHPATRSFQAIRIFINQEITQLSEVLAQTPSILAPKGRLCVLSFHSIEDRVVKQFIQKHTKPSPLPKGLPIVQDTQKTKFKNLGKYFASKEELQHNKRSRSAILRVAQRTKF